MVLGFTINIFNTLGCFLPTDVLLVEGTLGCPPVCKCSLIFTSINVRCKNLSDAMRHRYSGAPEYKFSELRVRHHCLPPFTALLAVATGADLKDCQFL